MRHDWSYFMSLVSEDESGCWVWNGTLCERGGYGKFCGELAHRVSYEYFVGPVPAGLELDHLCNNPPCVNPAHLEPVTRAENQRRRIARMTHCKNGHEFTAENSYENPATVRAGWSSRVCRACQRDYARAYRARKRLERRELVPD